jgi:hypothetical protein
MLAFDERSDTMAEIPRFNGAIRALEQGKPAFTAFCPPEIGMAQAIGVAPYDAVVFEMSTTPTTSRRCAIACNTCSTGGKLPSPF